jgi:hypothetical protein
MDRPCNTYGKSTAAYKILVGIPDEKRPLEIAWLR